jgi:3-hydroxyisobutyrate dehydrogenase
MNARSVALLGTGTMGAGMARNIAAAGFDLTVWNRSPERARPLAQVGARLAENPADAVRGAGIVVTMLWDADAVAAVVEQAADGLAPSTVWLQTSTVGIDGIRRLADLARARQLTLVDAPVLGTKQPAEAGELVVLAGGWPEVRPVVDPVFDAIGQRTLWVAEKPGPASALKLVVNGWLGTLAEGVAEALTAARYLRLDPELFLDAISGGPLDAPFAGRKGRAMLDGRFDPAFTLAGTAKDVGLELDGVRSVSGRDGDLRVLEAVRGHLDKGVAEGHGRLDVAATYLSHPGHRA